MLDDRESPPAADFDVAAAVFGVLSSPLRLRLLLLLADQPTDVGSLARQLDRPMPAISQHLARLRSVGLVSAHARGRHQLYAVANPEIIHGLRRLLALLAPSQYPSKAGASAG